MFYLKNQCRQMETINSQLMFKYVKQIKGCAVNQFNKFKWNCEYDLRTCMYGLSAMWNEMHLSEWDSINLCELYRSSDLAILRLHGWYPFIYPVMAVLLHYFFSESER